VHWACGPKICQTAPFAADDIYCPGHGLIIKCANDRHEACAGQGRTVPARDKAALQI
jgi:hypothetical protein